MKEFQHMLKRAVPVHDYLNSVDEMDRPKYDHHRETYKPKEDILDEMKQHAKDFIVICFSAHWCKDCHRHIPALDLIHEVIGLDVQVLGGVKTDPLDPNRLWAVPPSPPEVETLSITHLPTIIVYTRKGKEIGRIIENPQVKETLEEELLYLLNEAIS